MLAGQLDYEKGLLTEYARSHNIYSLTSEDILKLFEKSYTISEILKAFNI